MGQYYYTVNLDKEEFLMPHRLGDGLKLLEFGCSSNGTLTALALLLADGNGRGGGDIDESIQPEHRWFKRCPSDFRVENSYVISGTKHKIIVPKLVGHWAGDRIVTAGDYADEGNFLTEEQIERFRNDPEAQSGWEDGEIHDPNLYGYAQRYFKDISYDMLIVMSFESWMRDDIIVHLHQDMKWEHSKKEATRTLKRLQKIFDLSDEKVAEILKEKEEEDRKRRLSPDMLVSL
jgi:hypothetical protein